METFFGSRDPNSNTNAMGSTTLVLGNNPSISQSQIVRYCAALAWRGGRMTSRPHGDLSSYSRLSMAGSSCLQCIHFVQNSLQLEVNAARKYHTVSIQLIKSGFQ